MYIEHAGAGLEEAEVAAFPKYSERISGRRLGWSNTDAQEPSADRPHVVVG
jgi:hypothetical protein